MNIRLIQLYDSEEIIKYLSQEDLYQNIIKTNNLTPKDLFTNKRKYYLVLDENLKVLGVFITQMEEENRLSFHGGLYKDSRHKNTKEIVKEIIDNKIMAYHPGVTLCTSLAPKDKTTKHIVEYLGMKPVGKIDNRIIYERG